MNFNNNGFIANKSLPKKILSNEQEMITYALSLLGKAANFAVVPISGFHVGAIAIDAECNFYFGANQEYGAALAQTVHAEQSAIAHAWVCGAKSICHMVVNYTPCGHCRQFMNELVMADELKIHLPHCRNNRLLDYLPDSFGPADLNISQRIFIPSTQVLHSTKSMKTEIEKKALLMAEKSHAPYTLAYAGLALQTKSGEIFGGAYLENAAFNPSLAPLQMALNSLHLSGKTTEDIVVGCLVCVADKGHEKHTQSLWSIITDAPLKILMVEI